MKNVTQCNPTWDQMMLNTKLTRQGFHCTMEVFPHLSCRPVSCNHVGHGLIVEREWVKGGANFHPLQGVQRIIGDRSFFHSSLLNEYEKSSLSFYS